MVDTSGADGRRRFGTEHEMLRENVVVHAVVLRLVVEARDVGGGRESVAQRRLMGRHAVSDRPCGVFAVYDVLKEEQFFGSVDIPV